VRDEAPLKTYFTPGERFSYGSSAFAWLQRAMETVTGKSLQCLAGERVFDPFGLEDSSLEWQTRFEGNHAEGHDWDSLPVPKRRMERAQASWSLVTTATDYARFLQAVLKGTSLSSEILAQWFAPVVHPRQGDNAEDLLGENPPAENISWGLGWGLEPTEQCFFHWGHSPGFRAFVIGNRATADAVVWLANGARGLRLAHDILPATLSGQHPSIDWMQIGT
jgi:CubicO group peptidase (beta-lactamase class C family)